MKLHQRTPLTILLTAALIASVGGCAVVNDAAHKGPEAPGLYNTVTKTTVDLGMTKAEVEQLLGEPDGSGAFEGDLDETGAEFGIYHYGKDENRIEVAYSGNQVTRLVPEPQEDMHSNWGTKERIGYGSSREEVESNYEVTDSTNYHYDENGNMIDQTPSWGSDIFDDEYWMTLGGTDETGVNYIHLEAQPSELPDLGPDPVEEDSPALVNPDDKGKAVWLGMTKAEAGERFGYAMLKQHDPEYASYYGNEAQLTYYDYLGIGYPLMISYEGDKAVQIIASYKGQFCMDWDKFPDIETYKWATPKGITLGSTLSDIQAAYGDVTVSKDNNPKWFGSKNHDAVTTATAEADGYSLLFWLTDADGVFGFCLNAQGTPLPNTGGDWPI